MTLEELLADIHALEEDILAFERKYGVRSETFYAAYVSGEEPEDDAWVFDVWGNVLVVWIAHAATRTNPTRLVLSR